MGEEGKGERTRESLDFDSLMIAGIRVAVSSAPFFFDKKRGGKCLSPAKTALSHRKAKRETDHKHTSARREKRVQKVSKKDKKIK